jgi:hypothetical protein
VTSQGTSSSFKPNSKFNSDIAVITAEVFWSCPSYIYILFLGISIRNLLKLKWFMFFVNVDKEDINIKL